MDIVVIARLAKLPEPATAHALSEDVPKAVFEINNVLKGAATPNEAKEIRTVIFGQEQVGDQFLIMGAGAPDVSWSTPMKVSERAVKYLRQLGSLPEKGPERLAFFQDYLEDPELLLSRDAYDEFAKAPYSELKGLREKMNHEQLVTWIKSPDTPLNRKRLYMVMLSVCGGAGRFADAGATAALGGQESPSRTGCHARMLPDAGGPRRHAARGRPVHRELESGVRRHVRRDHGLAVPGHGNRRRIPPADLAGFALPVGPAGTGGPDHSGFGPLEDWSQVERLVKLFKEADKKSSWVRVPIINFLRTCPKPEAKQHLEELAKIDPEAVKRAETFFPFGGGAAPRLLRLPPPSPRLDHLPNQRSRPHQSRRQKANQTRCPQPPRRPTNPPLRRPRFRSSIERPRTI